VSRITVREADFMDRLKDIRCRNSSRVVMNRPGATVQSVLDALVRLLGLAGYGGLRLFHL
jgi:hypothetical protein